MIPTNKILNRPNYCALCLENFVSESSTMKTALKREIKAELSVYGYIRENYGHFEAIPVELLQLCLEMYLIKLDSWSTKLSNTRYQFNKNGLAALGANDNNPGDLFSLKTFPNAFGDLVIGKGELMEWKFNRNSQRNFKDAAVMIGIIEEDKTKQARDNIGNFFACYKRTEGGRSFYPHNGKKYGSKCLANDYIDSNMLEKVADHETVMMKLDMTRNKGILSFKTGNAEKDEFIDHGIAFNDIDVEKKYRMAVSLWGKSETVQIVP